MAIPRYRLPLKLRAWTWVYLNRALWMLGMAGRFESYASARKRAEAGGQALIQLAQTHDKVVVFAHGYLNLHIRRVLQRQGWQQTQKSNKYWGISRFTY